MRTLKTRLLLVFFVLSALIVAGCDLLGGSSLPKSELESIEVPSFSEWVFQRGEWKVENGKLIHDSDQSGGDYGNTSAYAPVEQKGENLVFEWTVEFVSTTITTGPSAGMHLMSDDPTLGLQRGNSYMIWQDKSRIQVYRTTNGNLGKVVQEFSVPVEAGSTHTYRVAINVPQGSLQIFRDGSYVGTVTVDNPILEGAYISTRTNGTKAAFTDIKVWKAK